MTRRALLRLLPALAAMARVAPIPARHGTDGDPLYAATLRSARGNVGRPRLTEFAPSCCNEWRSWGDD